MPMFYCWVMFHINLLGCQKWNGINTLQNLRDGNCFTWGAPNSIKTFEYLDVFFQALSYLFSAADKENNNFALLTTAPLNYGVVSWEVYWVFDAALHNIGCWDHWIVMSAKWSSHCSKGCIEHEQQIFCPRSEGFEV